MPGDDAEFMREYSGIAAKDRRIAELEAALRQLCDDVEAVLPEIRSSEAVAHVHGMMEPFTGKNLPTAVAEARAALPDTEGPTELRPVRPGPHIAAMPGSNERTDSWRLDTEGEQDGE